MSTYTVYLQACIININQLRIQLHVLCALTCTIALDVKQTSLMDIGSSSNQSNSTSSSVEGKQQLLLQPARQLNELCSQLAMELVYLITVTVFEKSRLPRTQQQDTLHHQTIDVHMTRLSRAKQFYLLARCAMQDSIQNYSSYDS